MQANSPERVFPFNLDLVFRRGLCRTLLLCMVGLTMVPMALVGIISTQTAHQRVEQEVRQNIRMAAELKSRKLQTFFAHRLVDADRQGRERTTVSFFNTLVRRYAATEGTVSEFVRSIPWAMTVSAFESGMELHASLHGYSDVLMIDPAGNILFSNARQKDLAGNLNQADVAKTRFAAAVHRTLDSGNPEVYGFESYAPTGGSQTAFVTAAIRAESSQPLGVIAFKIPTSAVNQILSEPMDLGADSRVYLIDADLTLLAGTIGGQPLEDDTTIETASTQLWRDNLTAGNSGSPQTAPFIYSGPGGNLVMGTYAEIRLGDTPYALIVEIETKAAFGAIHWLRSMIVTIVIFTGVGALVVSLALARTIVGPVRDLSQNMLMVAEGRLDLDIGVTANNEIGELAAGFGGMLQHLNAVKMENDDQLRFMSGLTRLQGLIAGEQELGELCLNMLEFLADFLNLNQADFFIVKGDGGLTCTSRFPGHAQGEDEQIFYPGDGRVGQAVLGKGITFFSKDPIGGMVTPAPSADLANLVDVPLRLQQTVKGVLELEKPGVFSRFDYRFVEAAAAAIAVAVNSASTRLQEEALLVQTREQAKQLKIREAALESSTRELKAQSRTFLASEEKLHLKQLELEAANAQMMKNAADLEAHMAILETQKLDMQNQNTELEKTHRELAEKARQLEISSQYKTEFMANMSHELRTPLNSILLLSRLLLENKEKTLSAKQSEFAQTIHSAGEDLLNLINEILDLAKVESGKMAVELQAVRVQSIADAMQISFAPLAEQSGIAFTSHVAPDVPERLITDHKRIEQILKNFLSNAFKFTTRGSIHLEIAVSREIAVCRGTDASIDSGCLAIGVVDTGIGIPADKHQLIFDAFQQVDGSTRRKYGGTGLGLSISRELARLLGGEITVESEAGRGSRFTLHLPIISLPERASAGIHTDPFKTSSIHAVKPLSPMHDASADPVPDNHNRLRVKTNHRPGLKDRHVLLVDDDMRTVFAVSNVLEDLGAKVIAGKSGKESLDKLNSFPDIDLVILDVMVSEVNGYQSIREIRNREQYRTIPIIALTAKAMQGDRAKCIEAGADDYLAKPVNFDKLTAMLKVWLDPQPAAPEHIGA